MFDLFLQKMTKTKVFLIKRRINSKRSYIPWLHVNDNTLQNVDVFNMYSRAWINICNFKSQVICQCCKPTNGEINTQKLAYCKSWGLWQCLYRSTYYKHRTANKMAPLLVSTQFLHDVAVWSCISENTSHEHVSTPEAVTDHFTASKIINRES